jgi:hypothetical protein
MVDGLVPPTGAHDPSPPVGTIDLHWIPLGVGAHVVRMSGWLFEALTALLQRRAPRALYHTGLQVFVPEGRFVIEQTPVVDGHGAERGVVGEGPVGMRWLRHFRIFRYEVRRWQGGRIPDIDEAVASPARLAVDLDLARRILDRLPSVPRPVWGRDELRVGEMWNSNSVIAWALACSGVNLTAVRPPEGGRAPGWNAGVRVAMRDQAAREPIRREPSATSRRTDDVRVRVCR